MKNTDKTASLKREIRPEDPLTQDAYETVMARRAAKLRTDLDSGHYRRGRAGVVTQHPSRLQRALLEPGFDRWSLGTLRIWASACITIVTLAALSGGGVAILRHTHSELLMLAWLVSVPISAYVAALAVRQYARQGYTVLSSREGGDGAQHLLDVANHARECVNALKRRHAKDWSEHGGDNDSTCGRLQELADTLDGHRTGLQDLALDYQHTANAAADAAPGSPAALRASQARDQLVDAVVALETPVRFWTVKGGKQRREAARQLATDNLPSAPAAAGA